MTEPAPTGAAHGGAVALLRSTTELRRRCAALLARARGFESHWFRINDGALETAAELVAEITLVRYPDLRVPPHSRWRHFGAGGIDRVAALDRRLAGAPAAQRTRARIDLALVSVLLDAGAGPDWVFRERDPSCASEHSFARSEGLAVASFHAFRRGVFSSDPQDRLRVDAQALAGLDAERLGAAFQVRPDNPLVGLEPRAALLRRLGAALAARPEVFGGSDGSGPARPGALFDFLADAATRDAAPLTAHRVLDVLLDALAPVWPALNVVDGVALGDCWRHAAVRGPGASDGWVPFHKLTQWLVYSLIEPLQWGGLAVDGSDELTGLPEYRNGGLLLDAGVLRPIDARFAERPWHVGDEFIVEWRALTVALLDELAPLVRRRLRLSAGQLPLASVLEGGTWAAGRALAERLRGGLPPVRIVSDGTVF